MVQGCAKNDRRAQEALYRKYFPKMMGLTMYLVKDREKSLEIVNQGFLRVYQKIHTFRGEGSLEGWIKTLMLRARADYFKKDNKYLSAIILDEVEDGRHENTTMNDMYYQDIVKLIDRLPAATAEVFRLYAIEGFKHAEIAEQLGISVGTSKWHLSAARQKLKELIGLYYNKETQRDVG